MHLSCCLGRTTTIIALTVSRSLFVLSARGYGAEVTLEQLLDKSHQSANRLKTDAASWRFTKSTQGGKLSVDVVRHGDDFRWIVQSQGASGPHELCCIICRNGIWYASNDQKDRGKFRPYETPWITPIVYGVVCHCDPLIPEDLLRRDQLSLTSRSEKAVVLHGPLFGGPGQMVAALLADAEKRKNEDPKLQAMITQLEQVQKKGTDLTIDGETGFVTDVSMVEPLFSITEFKWLENVPAEAFNTDALQWPDYTFPFVEQFVGSHFLINRYASSQEAAQLSILGGLLTVDKTTALVRRVPCRVGPTSMGCFSADRKQVYATAVDSNTGLNRVVQVNLATGENSEISDDVRDEMTLYPAVSPDGKKLAVLNRGKELPFNETRVCIVNLANRKAERIGPPGDYFAPCWLPDASGFVLVADQHSSDQKALGRMICRMSMNGELRPIRNGYFARVLEGNSRILFQEKPNADWKTCDLNGGDEKTVADGLFEYIYAAPSADGQSAIMVKQVGRNYRPFIVDLRSGMAKEVQVGDGSWWLPEWR
jgi:hypothetical protein